MPDNIPGENLQQSCGFSLGDAYNHDIGGQATNPVTGPGISYGYNCIINDGDTQNCPGTGGCITDGDGGHPNLSAVDSPAETILILDEKQSPNKGWECNTWHTKVYGRSGFFLRGHVAGDHAAGPEHEQHGHSG